MMHLCKVGSTGAMWALMVMGFKPAEGATAQDLLGQFSRDGESSVQLMDHSMVAGYEHILTASILASKSWEQGRNISRSPATEVLLYASARKQIKEAIEAVGVRDCGRGWVLIAMSNEEPALKEIAKACLKYGSEEEMLLSMAEYKFPQLMAAFSISEDEVSMAMKLVGSRENAIQSLVIEQVSLSDLYR